MAILGEQAQNLGPGFIFGSGLKGLGPKIGSVLGPKTQFVVLHMYRILLLEASLLLNTPSNKRPPFYEFL